jgi:hypothetical protein
MKYISLSLQNIPELVVPLMIPFIEGAAVDQRETDRRRENYQGKSTIYKTLHRKINIEKHEHR